MTIELGKTKQSDDAQVRRPAWGEYGVTTRTWLVRMCGYVIYLCGRVLAVKCHVGKECILCALFMYVNSCLGAGVFFLIHRKYHVAAHTYFTVPLFTNFLPQTAKSSAVAAKDGRTEEKWKTKKVTGKSFSVWWHWWH